MTQANTPELVYFVAQEDWEQRLQFFLFLVAKEGVEELCWGCQLWVVSISGRFHHNHQKTGYCKKSRHNETTCSDHQYQRSSATIRWLVKLKNLKKLQNLKKQLAKLEKTSFLKTGFSSFGTVLGPYWLQRCVACCSVFLFVVVCC